MVLGRASDLSARALALALAQNPMSSPARALTLTLTLTPALPPTSRRRMVSPRVCAPPKSTLPASSVCMPTLSPELSAHSARSKRTWGVADGGGELRGAGKEGAALACPLSLHTLPVPVPVPVPVHVPVPVPPTRTRTHTLNPYPCPYYPYS